MRGGNDEHSRGGGMRRTRAATKGGVESGPRGTSKKGRGRGRRDELETFCYRVFLNSVTSAPSVTRGYVLCLA